MVPYAFSIYRLLNVFQLLIVDHHQWLVLGLGVVLRSVPLVNPLQCEVCHTRSIQVQVLLNMADVGSLVTIPIDLLYHPYCLVTYALYFTSFTSMFDSSYGAT